MLGIGRGDTVTTFQSVFGIHLGQLVVQFLELARAILLVTAKELIVGKLVLFCDG